MVKASGQIEQTLGQLQHKTAEIAEELETLYKSYLEALSKAARQKLALATYHLCTQIYPEQFLDLSLSQRSRLQKLIQQLGKQLHEQLLAKWDETGRLSRRPEQEDGISLIKQLFLRLESEVEDFSEDDEEDPDDLDAVLADLTDDSTEIEAIKSQLLKRPLLLKDADEHQDLHELDDTDDVDTDDVDADDINEAETADESSLLELSSEDSEQPSRQPSDLDSQRLLEMQDLIRERLVIENLDQPADLTADLADDENEPEPGPLEPIQLVRQQLLMEKAIRDVLRALSETANYLLQQANIIPELPKALLAAAAESEGLAQTPIKTPNLLKISVKVFHGTDSEEPPAKGKKRRPPKLVQIEGFPEFFVIHLRLSEIEFAEPQVLLWRSQIREKMGKLKQLGSAYQAAQRELAIANAEEAWRSSWIEE